MAALALLTAGRVEISDPHLQHTLISAVDLEAGSPVIPDVNGKWKLALATTLAAGGGAWVGGRKCKAGEPLTAFRNVKMDGFDLSGHAYNTPIYLGDDGSLNTVAGTVSLLLARVLPVWAQTFGNSPSKVLQIVSNS